MWDDWDDTVLQTQDSKFEPWRSETEHATSQSRRLPTILTFTRGWRRNNLVSFKPPKSGSGANHYPRAPARRMAEHCDNVRHGDPAMSQHLDNVSHVLTIAARQSQRQYLLTCKASKYRLWLCISVWWVWFKTSLGPFMVDYVAGNWRIT